MRTDGYLPIADYALIGDGHTTALVGRDGSIDWLCLPNAGSPSVFDRILDADEGGRFELRPLERFEAVRRYREHTNVLETVFTTTTGSVRVTDAMTQLEGERRDLVRLVDQLDGTVPMQWRFAPRGDHTQLEFRAWDAGDGHFELGVDRRATFLVSTGALSSREDAELEVERSSARWMDWTSRATYDGRWSDAVLRSALVLKLLTYDPTGAILAAPTTSLPERIGGDLNWDYRYSWLRDGIYTMRALLSLGYREEAQAFFDWQMDAIRPDVPEVKPLYRLDGTSDEEEEQELDLPGYRGSRPVRLGNAAADQLQLDVYGHLLESASRLRQATGALGPDVGRELAALADFVAEAWRRKDAGIWEVRDELHDFVQSKAMCWTALDRAARLAGEGAIPGSGARWREEADAVRDWIETEGWNEKSRTYVRAPDLGDEVDASLLSLPLCAYSRAAEPRFRSTLDAVSRELSAGGPLLYRNAESKGTEGAFLTCSFWLVDTLGRAGRAEEGHELMKQLVELGNDVGLYAEEIDPENGEQLGNFPQGLVHLALVNAAVSLENGEEG
ncbi:MAG: glycoside hydrolase family 15 protein [Actinomycetota bacterium]|nr:glycoside hydrolase family 15 protein [Actinomycetota bacterium]